MEEGQRGAADPVAGGGAAEARVRDQQAHRAEVGRGGAISCGVALPAALPAGTARLAEGEMGGEERAEAQALLPADAAGAKRAGFAASRMEGIRDCDRENYGAGNGGGKCVNGKRKCCEGLLR